MVKYYDKDAVLSSDGLVEWRRTFANYLQRPFNLKTLHTFWDFFVL